MSGSNFNGIGQYWMDLDSEAPAGTTYYPSDGKGGRSTTANLFLKQPGRILRCEAVLWSSPTAPQFNIRDDADASILLYNTIARPSTAPNPWTIVEWDQGAIMPARWGARCLSTAGAGDWRLRIWFA